VNLKFLKYDNINKFIFYSPEENVCLLAALTSEIDSLTSAETDRNLEDKQDCKWRN
jgi:hypothetical protein